MDEFTRNVPISLGTFIGHHQSLSASAKNVLSRVFKSFFSVFYITLQNYVNAELDKSVLLMTSNEFKKTEHYQRKWNIIKKIRILNKKNNNAYTLNFHSECPFRYERIVIKTLISRAKQRSSLRTIFLNELRNIKQTHLNYGFPNLTI